MHAQILKNLQHTHDFSVINRKGEHRTRLVLILTFFTMCIEITAGVLFNSMALLADGWHMATHVAAFMITLFAYRYSRLHAHDHTFAFSPGKVGVLGGFASCIALSIVSLLMLIESGEHFFNPTNIHYDEAIVVASFGLLINLLSAFLLKDNHHHHSHHHSAEHTHEHKHEHHHAHHDHNLKAAYTHVIADALTSILALTALGIGKYYGFGHILDPLMGVIGALVIAHWSYGLLRETSPVLIDESIAFRYKQAITEHLESDADNRVADLHIWRVGPGHFAVIISIVSDNPQTPSYYKERLHKFHTFDGRNTLSHITIEVNQCPDGHCAKAAQN